MNTLWKDLQWAVRTLLRRPVFSGFAVLSLALGIGANAAIFSAVKAVLLYPIPVQEPSRLVAILNTSVNTSGLFPVSFAEYEDFTEFSGSLSEISLHQTINAYLLQGERPEVVLGGIVSGNYFDLLGVKPALGRAFRPEEDRTPGSHPVVVISHDFWRQRCGGDPEILGKTLRLNNARFTVVGVAPPGFRGLSTFNPQQFWVPVMSYEHVLFGVLKEWFPLRDGRIFQAVGRLRPGVSLDSARAEMNRLAERLRQEHPIANEGMGLTLRPLLAATINPNVQGAAVRIGSGLMAGVGLLLLIAAVNVGNLLMVRGIERRKEVAIRLSMGATRRRLFRLLLVEGLVLALAAGVTGLLLAIAGSKLLWALRPPFIHDSMSFSLDATVLGVTFLVCCGVGVLFALAPFSQLARRDSAHLLRHGTETILRRSPLGLNARSFFVAAQVSLCLMALIAAGLLGKSLLNAYRIDLGFDSDHLVLIPVDLGPLGYDERAGQQLYRQVLERAETVPRVRSASLSDRVPLIPKGFRVSIELEGSPTPPELEGFMIPIDTVGLKYFETLGIPILEGREFAPDDRSDTRAVVVVNQRLAEMFWPGRSALGQRFRFSGEEEAFEVVGIAATAKAFFLGEDPVPMVYLASSQNFDPTMTFAFRTVGDPRSVVNALRREVREVDPQLPNPQVQVFADLVDEQLWTTRLGAYMLVLLGMIALLLTGFGIYGLVSFTVHQRKHEIGIRLALGGLRPRLSRLVLTQGMRVVAIGIGLGLAGALVATRFMRTLLFAVGGFDPATFAVVTGIIAAVALAANYFAARKVAGVEPMDAIRQG